MCDNAKEYVKCSPECENSLKLARKGYLLKKVLLNEDHKSRRRG